MCREAVPRWISRHRRGHHYILPPKPEMPRMGKCGGEEQQGLGLPVSAGPVRCFFPASAEIGLL